MLHGWHHLSPEQLQTIEEGIIAGEARGGPYHLEIHPTNKCNAKCHFCCTEHFRFGEALPFDMLKGIIEEESERDLNFVRLIGGGEPLIYPQIRPLIDVIANSNLKGFDLITNGIALGPLADQLITAGCEEIHVSLNEPNAELYEETMRIPAKNFDRVIEGMKKAAEARDRVERETGRRCKLNTQFFLNKRNWELIEKIYDLVREIDVDYADFRSAFAPQSGADRQRVEEEVVPRLREMILPIVRRDCESDRPILRISMGDHFELNHEIYQEQKRLLPEGDERVKEFKVADPRLEYCYMPFYSATVTAKGSIAACCVLSEHLDKTLGDLYQKSLQEIWYGEFYKRMRGQFRKLMLLRGNMRHSPKKHTQILPVCVANFGCHMTFSLATDDFYERMRDRMEGEWHGSERFSAWREDRAVRTVHKGREVQRAVLPR